VVAEWFPPRDSNIFVGQRSGNCRWLTRRESSDSSENVAELRGPAVNIGGLNSERVVSVRSKSNNVELGGSVI
jgi:hypothetical protein